MATVERDPGPRIAATCSRRIAASPIFVRGEGRASVRQPRRAYLDLPSGIGVASLGHGHAGLAAGGRRPGAHAAPHVEPVSPPAAGATGCAAVGPVRARARVLRQQRHRGDRGVPPSSPGGTGKRAGSRGRDSSRSRNPFTAARSAHCRSPPTSITARRSSRCCRASGWSRRSDRRRSWPWVVDGDGGDHRRADPGRGRRAPAPAGVCGGG